MARTKEEQRSYQNQWRAKKVAKGVCRNCKNKAIPGQSCCIKCRDRAKGYDKIRFIERKSLGKCATCNNDKAEHLTLCLKCWFEAAAKKHLGSRKRWVELKDKLENQNHICPRTGRILTPGINASVDHIIPRSLDRNLEFDINNVEWTDYNYNLAKNSMSTGEMIRLAEDIINNQIVRDNEEFVCV